MAHSAMAACCTQSRAERKRSDQDTSTDNGCRLPANTYDVSVGVCDRHRSRNGGDLAPAPMTHIQKTARGYNQCAMHSPTRSEVSGRKAALGMVSMTQLILIGGFFALTVALLLVVGSISSLTDAVRDLKGSIDLIELDTESLAGSGKTISYLSFWFHRFYQHISGEKVSDDE